MASTTVPFYIDTDLTNSGTSIELTYRQEITTPSGAFEQTTTAMVTYTGYRRRHDTSSDIVCKTYEFVIGFVFVGVLTLFGLVGNGLAMRVMWKQVRASATCLLLFCLAIADDVVLVVYMVMAGLQALYRR
jgi:hypothetical protein